MILRLFGLALLAAFASPVSAQTPAALPGQSLGGSPVDAPAACSYDDCALRVEPEPFGSPLILRGVDSVPVDRIGLFFGSDLSQAVSGDEAAYAYARRAERDRTGAVLLALGGGAAVIASGIYAYGDPDRASVATLLGGGLLIASGAVQIGAARAQSRAVWEYNRELSR